MASSDFAHLRAAGEVSRKTNGRKLIQHPELGRLDLEWSTLNVAAVPGQMVVAYQRVPGTRAVDVLAELGRGDRVRSAASNRRS